MIKKIATIIAATSLLALTTSAVFAVDYPFRGMERRATPSAARPRYSRFTSTLSAINGNTLTVGSYTVTVTPDTKLVRKFGATATLSEFSVGDQLQVAGSVIRNLSIQKRRGTFVGSVSIISGNTITLNTLHRGPLTVTVSSRTQITDRKNMSLTVDKIMVGHKLVASGLWDSKLNTLTEVSKLRDLSLPLRPLPPPPPPPAPPAKTPVSLRA